MLSQESHIKAEDSIDNSDNKEINKDLEIQAIQPIYDVEGDLNTSEDKVEEGNKDE